MKFVRNAPIMLYVLMNISFAKAEIRETLAMATAFAAVDRETLLVLDIDNTILKPAQMLGTEHWYEKLLKGYMAKGISLSEAIDRTIPIWKQIQNSTPVIPVEPNTPTLIADAQKRGFKVIALTARPIDFVDGCIQQLQSIGIDFSKHSPWQNEMSIQAESEAKYAKGVIFSGPKNNKGHVFRKFLERSGLKPKKVVFVDDKEKHVISMQSALADLGISYSGFRYGVTDLDHKNYDDKVAEVQLRFLGKIIDDKTARLILHNAADAKL